MSSIRQRIERLSPAQRGELARRIRKGARSNRLLAYVTASPDVTSLDVPALRRHLQRRLPPHMVPAAIVELEKLPRLPNGKLDRGRLPGGSASEPASTESRGAASGVEETLVAIWREVLGLEEVSVHDDFFEIGGDSILSIQMISRARSAGLELSPADLADYPTVAGLAGRASVALPPEAVAPEMSGPVPLTPMQRWFFELGLARPEQWNQAVAIDFASSVDGGVLEEVVRRLPERHPQLRAGFRHAGGEWIQELGEAEAPQEIDPGDPEALALHRSFRFDGGPLARFAVGRENGTWRLVIVAHHLVIDQVSWQILVHDLKVACRSRIESGAAEWPMLTDSFARWAEGIASRDPGALRDELAYWEAGNVDALGRLPTDETWEGPLREADSEVVRVALEAGPSQDLLLGAGKAYHGSVEDLLLTALVRVMARWSGKTRFRIGSERHGRDVSVENLDVSRSVGWFTVYFPLRVSLDGGDDIGKAVKSVKEQIRAVPRGGITYGQLRYGGDEAVRRQVSADEEAEDVLFNYLGNRGGGAAPDFPVEAVTPLDTFARAPENRRSHLLEINSCSEGGVFKMSWTYNARAHRKGTIENWAAAYLEELRAIVHRCVSAETPEYTPSDFPESGMSQEELDDFLEQL